MKKATINNYNQEVWYLSDAITNIFSLKNVRKQYRVTYDSDEGCFIVHHKEFGLLNMIFQEHPCGLHYYNPQLEQGSFNFVETVHANKALFTKRQVKGAQLA